MSASLSRIRGTYFTPLLGNTLAASFIWGVNTLFLLDAGLSNFEAFAANAFFTAGMVLFEIPTGVIADMWGRRISYLFGTVTLAAATGAYYLLWVVHAPFWSWALVSVFIGLGFTFFSGALEAWLVDALKFCNYSGNIEEVFGRGQMVGGIGMLVGSVAGGFLAQAASLGMPFLFRIGVFGVMFVVAYLLMHDLGFSPERGKKPLSAMRSIISSSVDHGIRNPPVRWLMLASPFGAGVGIYTFYALQPFLLSLYGNSDAYIIAGLAAAIVALSQMAGGYLAPYTRRLFKKRTTVLLLGVIVSAFALLGIGLVQNFLLALFLLVIWGLVFAATGPIRQAYLNDLIPTNQRATILSFDSLMGNAGGVVIQPALGRAADVWSYGTSFIIGGAIQVLAIPFLIKSRSAGARADGQNS